MQESTGTPLIVRRDLEMAAWNSTEDRNCFFFRCAREKTCSKCNRIALTIFLGTLFVALCAGTGIFSGVMIRKISNDPNLQKDHALAAFFMLFLASVFTGIFSLALCTGRSISLYCKREDYLA